MTETLQVIRWKVPFRNCGDKQLSFKKVGQPYNKLMMYQHLSNAGVSIKILIDVSIEIKGF